MGAKREAGNDDQANMSAREAAHVRQRDRKRITRMIVDNAGVKRILPAVKENSADKSKS